jgi:DNA-binding transcriptional MerR regulator
MDDDLLPIGRFAAATGLTITALRHYDDEGILRPADVDPVTGYRRYRRDQVAHARAVAALRDLELSIPAIRALQGAGDEATRGEILRTERLRLEARTARLQRALHRLRMLSGSEAPAPASAARAAPSSSVTTSTAPSSATPSSIDKEIRVPTKPPTLEPETHRALGAGLFNRTWDLLEVEARTPAQDDEMIDTAHASAWHWRQVGNTANEARGHWMCSRVYAVLGRAEPAVHHARRAWEVLAAGGDGIKDWDAPAAAEAMARALAISGDPAGAAEWKRVAEEGLAKVADEEDRRVVEADLATVPIAG